MAKTQTPKWIHHANDLVEISKDLTELQLEVLSEDSVDRKCILGKIQCVVKKIEKRIRRLPSLK